MRDYEPRYMANREFVELEEEDIQRINRMEAQKFARNPEMTAVMSSIEEQLGPEGHWEEHWMTVDPKGSCVYARVYYTDDRGMAVTADGHVVREINFPKEDNE